MNANLVVFVTPNAWFYEPDGSKIKQTTKALMTGNIVYADASRRISEEFFPGVGEDTWFESRKRVELPEWQTRATQRLHVPLCVS